MVRGRTRAVPTGWLGGLGCGALIMVDPATAVFLAALLAPSALVRISDDRPERAGTRPVLLCNVAAIIGPICRLWREMPPTTARALQMICGTNIVAWAWLAAGIGWLLSEAMTLAARRWLMARDQKTTNHVTAEIADLTAEWGVPSMGAKQAAP